MCVGPGESDATLVFQELLTDNWESLLARSVDTAFESEKALSKDQDMKPTAVGGLQLLDVDSWPEVRTLCGSRPSPRAEGQ